jgi:ATP-dependent RNA helicase DDX49/DBP8
LLGCAKTGTGKTLAFALPILQQVIAGHMTNAYKSIYCFQLAVDPYGIFALILTPTRELAFQIGEQFEAFGRQLSLKCSIIVGGRHQMAQAQELCRRPHILIATPGLRKNRIVDLDKKL